MNGSSLMFYRIPKIARLAFLTAIVSALLWAAVAQAQTPTEDQYGDPTASLSAAGGSSGATGEGGSSAAIGEGGSVSEGSQVVDPRAEGPQEGVLPSTGGPMLLAYAGALVASGAGLVLIRRRSS